MTDLRDGARSAAEASAIRRLARSAVPPFEANVPIHDRAGLEIDSREYHFGIGEWKATLDRHNALTGYGLAVTHYAPRRIAVRGSTFVADVTGWLERRAAELGVPMPHGNGVRRPPIGGDPPPYVLNAIAGRRR